MCPDALIGRPPVRLGPREPALHGGYCTPLMCDLTWY